MQNDTHDLRTAPERYDVIVVGAGHAGCEAALAAARMGCSTLLLTGNLDGIATMPCNPSVGGPAKGHVVREIDALGGEMGKVTDQTFIQIRMLNTGKGPAVQALRAQSDKRMYAAAMKRVLERQPGLILKQGMVTDLERDVEDNGRAQGVVVATASGRRYAGTSVVLTTGTFLNGRLIAGDSIQPGGRAGEAPATGVSGALRRLGFELGRLKTGTPPRIAAHTIDYSTSTIQPGSPTALHFSSWWCYLESEGVPHPDKAPHPEPHPVYPQPEPTPWRRQMACYLVATTPQTHEIIRANLHRAPMFTGVIEGVGPRYCPSIEDKIVRFADKQSHGLFLEPEGWETTEVYVQGANTSLPEDVQEAMIHSIPGLERAEIMRFGYAVEYDFVSPSQTRASMESKLVDGLFFAGQINGTSGYEEAAGQGLMAGINAACRVRRRPAVVLGRDQAYIGVMLYDLVTKDLAEPYRLLTSRAEYRLLLRQQSADLRLAPVGYELGLLSKGQYEAVEEKRERIRHAVDRLHRTFLPVTPAANAALQAAGLPPVERSVSAADYLRRTDVDGDALGFFGVPKDDEGVSQEIETTIRYAGYVERQEREVRRVKQLEERAIPEEFDYASLEGLRREARDKLQRFRPMTVGQASRLEGVTPADMSLLLVYLQRHERQRAS